MRDFFIALTRNPISLVGSAITTASALVILSLFAVGFVRHHQNPYVGILAFLILLVVVGLLLVPRFLRYVTGYKSDEMLLVTVLGLCFGVSLLTVALGYSVALGAFVIGTIIGEAREIGKIKLLTEPVRDMFSAVFFVSIGMLIDPRLRVKEAA